VLSLGGRTWQLVYPPCRKRMKKNFWEWLIEELNERFALQLDLEPSDRSSQSASDYVESDSISMIFAGSSHSARTIDAIDRGGLNLLDATIPGYRLSPETVDKLAEDIKDLVMA
jgi:hypothetical protein